MKKSICMVMAVAALLGNLSINAAAVEPSDTFYMVREQAVSLGARESNTFTVSIRANKNTTSAQSLSLKAGNAVRISAAYEPEYADVTIGLLDSDGTYYYLQGKNGKASGSIQAPKTGSYTLVIENNSSSTVQISGTVKY